jgi:hypothetical protein
LTAGALMVRTAIRPDTVGTVEHRGENRALHILISVSICHPAVDLGARDTREAAAGTHPERSGIVFQRPLNRIAR